MPDSTIVSEPSDKESNTRLALKSLETKLAALTANLLRISLEGGAPSRVLDDLYSCALAITRFIRQVGREPTAGELTAAISLQRGDQSGDQMTVLERAICRAAMQVVASTFDNQKSQRDLALAALRLALLGRDDRKIH